MIIGIDIDDTLTYLKNFKIELVDWPLEECSIFWNSQAETLLMNASP